MKQAAEKLISNPSQSRERIRSMTGTADGHTYSPYGGRSQKEYEQLLTAKLQPHNIRSTLAFAGLYQMTYEMLKQAILENVRKFYWRGINESGDIYDDQRYQNEVLHAAKAEGRSTKRFTASAAWLVRSGAITEEQAARLDKIYNHRHELTHEIASFIVDPDRDPDVQIFVDALAILKDVQGFWAEIEIDVGSFEHLGLVTPDEVTPLSLMLLQRCIDAYVEGTVHL